MNKRSKLLIFSALILVSVSAYAAAFFSDTFTVGSNTALESHTPDTGTSWTELVNTGASEGLDVIATSDTVTHIGSANAGEGILYTADVTYSSADYEITMLVVNAESGDDECIMAIRIQDSNNMYAFEFTATSGQLYEQVGGSWFTLGAATAGIASGSTVKLKMVGTTLSCEDDSVELRSVTDSSHSLAGKAGIGMGAIINSGADEHSQEYDNVQITEVVAGGSNNVVQNIL